MATLEGTSWGWSSWGRRIWRIIERCLVLIGVRVVRCGFVRSGNVSLAHRWMDWWSVSIAESRLLHAMVVALCKAHVRVVTSWTMRYIGVTVGWVR